VRRIALTLATVLALSGCGHSYTKRDFVARADAICASAVRAVRQVPPPRFASPRERLPELARYLARALPILQAESARLRALGRPPDQRALLARYLDELSHSVARYRALLTDAQRGDARALAADEAALRASPLPALAARYGLRSCAGPGATGA
jgi:hypothetical protein